MTVIVLILIVVDKGLVRVLQLMLNLQNVRLNPYCSGQRSRTSMV